MNLPESIKAAVGATRAADCTQHGAYTATSIGAIWSSCPQCVRESIRNEASEADAHVAAARRVALRQAARIPARFADARLDDGGHAQAMRGWLRAAARGAAALALLGPTGTGKTHLICGMIDAAVSGGVHTRYETAAGFQTRIASSWRSDEISERQVFAEYTLPQIMVLDDVGASSGSEVFRLKIGQVIDERYLQNKATAIISNLTPKLLQEELGDRAYSRMLEGLTQLNLTGADRRRSAA